MALQVTRSGRLIAYKRVNDLAHVKGVQLQLLQDSRKGVSSLCNESASQCKVKGLQERAEIQSLLLGVPSD